MVTGVGGALSCVCVCVCQGGYVEVLQSKEEEESSMHNTVVMFSTSDHFTLKQVISPVTQDIPVLFCSVCAHCVCVCVRACTCRTCVWCVAASVREQKVGCWPALSVDSVTIPTASTSRSVKPVI